MTIDQDPITEDVTEADEFVPAGVCTEEGDEEEAAAERALMIQRLTHRRGEIARQLRLRGLTDAYRRGLSNEWRDVGLRLAALGAAPRGR